MSDSISRHMSVRIIHQEFPSCFEAGQCPEDPHKELIEREVNQLRQERQLGTIATRATQEIAIEENAI